jgi:hypothetical protein
LSGGEYSGSPSNYEKISMEAKIKHLISLTLISKRPLCPHDEGTAGAADVNDGGLLNTDAETIVGLVIGLAINVVRATVTLVGGVSKGLAEAALDGVDNVTLAVTSVANWLGVT